MLTFLIMVVFFLEVLIVIGLVKLLFMTVDLNKRMPLIQETVLQDLRTIREEFKNINARLLSKPAPPLSPYELGQICSNLVMKLLLLKKIPLIDLLTLLLKYHKRIMPTLIKYQRTS